MTENGKKFMEFVSKNDDAHKDYEAALAGVNKEDRTAFTDATIKFAAKHGFELTAADFESSESEELSDEEMEAVAGGGCRNDVFLFFCGSDSFACATSSYLG